MAIIVQKYGGSSVATAEKIRNICQNIANYYEDGNQIIVVLSAQGDTTDHLVNKMFEITTEAPPREVDMLLSSGEQISIALAAMCMENMGYSAVSLTGWQAGIHTNSTYNNASIYEINKKKINELLSQGKIVFVAGFQGIDDEGNITTLGRGGSDTTAVSLAAWFSAETCQIYTDVDGVYTSDPRKSGNARKIDKLTYDEMLMLIEQGAQVLHKQSVLTAKKHNVAIEVLSSFSRMPGTIIQSNI